MASSLDSLVELVLRPRRGSGVHGHSFVTPFLEEVGRWVVQLLKIWREVGATAKVVHKGFPGASTLQIGARDETNLPRRSLYKDFVSKLGLVCLEALFLGAGAGVRFRLSGAARAVTDALAGGFAEEAGGILSCVGRDGGSRIALGLNSVFRLRGLEYLRAGVMKDGGPMVRAPVATVESLVDNQGCAWSTPQASMSSWSLVVTDWG